MTALFAVMQPVAWAQIVTDVTWEGGVGNLADVNWRNPTTLISPVGSDFNLRIDGGKAGNSIVHVNASDTKRNVTINTGDTLNITNNHSLTLAATAGVGSVENQGTLSLSSVGNSTNLILSGGTFSFSGTGTVRMGNNGANRIYGASGTDHLINAAGHTLEGSDQLGVGQLTLTNHGLILANQSTALSVDPSSGGMTNTGTMRATGGATLELANGTFTNTGGGVIDAQDNSHVDIVAATVVGGTLSSVGSGHFHAISNSSLANVALAAGSNLELANNQRLNASGTLQNAGTIQLLSVGNSTDFVADASGLTLSGGGTITLSNNAQNRIYGATSTTTLVNLDNTIRGAGQIGANQLQFDNRGTVDASIAGQVLTLNPSGSGVVNTGTLKASGGGILLLEGGTFTNTGGTVRAETGSTVRVESSTLSAGTLQVDAGSSLTLSSSTIDGGTLVGTSTGSISTVGGANVLGGVVTINSGTQVNVGNNTSLRLLATGTFTHHGTISLNSVGNLTDLIVSGGDVVIGGTGTIALGNNANNRIYGTAASDRLVLGAGLTLRGGGALGVGLMGLNNSGLIEATLAGTDLVVNPNALGVTNTGTLRATAGGTLRLAGGEFTSSGGSIVAQDLSRVTFENAAVAGGTFSTAGSGRLVNAASSSYAGVTLATGSVFDVNNNTSATHTGTFTNQGTVNLNSVGNLTDFIAGTGGATLAGGGVIAFGNNGNNRLYGVTGTTTLVNQDNTIRGAGQIGVNQLQLDNRGTVEASIGGSTLVLDTSGSGMVNTGTLQAVNGGILRLEGSVVNNSGGTVRAQNGSRVDLSSSTISGGTLSTAGTGVISTVAGGSTIGGTLQIASGSGLVVNNNTSLTFLASGIYTNDGTLALSSVGNFTDLKVSGGDVQFGGTGVIAMGNNGNNRIYGVGATDRLINSASHVIRGGGQIGVGLMGLVNQGLIKADLATSLVIDPSAAGVTNTGRLRAEAGATLRLEEGTFTNTGGTIEALGTGSRVDFSSASIIGGFLTSNVGASLRHLGGSTFTDVTLTSGSTLAILNNTGAIFLGTLTNQATVALQSVGNFTDFILNGDVVLDGGGTIALGDNGNNRLYASVATSTLTNRNNVIQGSGQLGVGLMGLINQSTIKATQPTALVIDPNAAGASNTGLLRAETGATLALQNGTFANSGGTIEAIGAGAVVSFLSATVSQGTLQSSAGGVLRNSGGASFTDVFLALGSTLQIPNNTSATFSGTLTSGGTVQLQSVGNLTNFLVGDGGLTLVGGTVELGNNGNNRIYHGGGTATLINQSAAIRGAGQLGVGLLKIDNRAVVDANLSGATLIVDPNSGGAKNTGLLTASNGGILRLKGGTYDNSGGTILAGTGSRVELEAATIVGGVIAGETIRNLGGSSLTSLNLSSGARLEIPNNTALAVAGAIGNSGTIALQSVGNFTDLVIAAGGVTLASHGVVELSNNGNNRIYTNTSGAMLNNANNTIRGGGSLGLGLLALTNNGTLEANQSTPLTVDLVNGSFVNQGTLRASNGGNLVFVDALGNAGSVVVGSSSTFTAQAAFTQTAGSTSLQAGTFNAASASFQGGHLQGSGTVGGATTNSGVIAPGSAGSASGVGTLAFTHLLTLTSTSLLQMELGSNSSFDRISAQSAALGGSLAVSFANGFQFAIQPSDTFTLLSTVNANGLTGAFAGLADGARFMTFDGAGTFQINYLANSVRLSNFAIVIPEPSTYVLFGVGLLVVGALEVRRRCISRLPVGGRAFKVAAARRQTFLHK